MPQDNEQNGKQKQRFVKFWGAIFGDGQMQ